LGGRQRWDRVLMFKILILQKLYEISDEATEYQINDRLSFQRFLGLELGDKVPDAKTIWKYKEDLAESGKSKELFGLYNAVLEGAKIVTRKGSIVDATIMQRPQQRYNKEKKEREKRGEQEPEETNPHKARQTDKDATYTKKHKKMYFGYKNNLKADAESKLILDYEVTTASVSDCKQIAELVDEKDEVLYGDSAFRGSKIAKEIIAGVRKKRKNSGGDKKGKKKRLKLMICEKAERGHPLTEEQRANNKAKAKIRCRVEHIFGYMVKSMGGKFLRQVGLARNKCAIALKNLAYNLCRSAYLLKQRVSPTLLPKPT
jgi:IS5 family transposase